MTHRWPTCVGLALGVTVAGASAQTSTRVPAVPVAVGAAEVALVRRDVTLLPGMETPRWHVKMAMVDAVPALVSLVQGYWQFEQIPGFDEARVSAALRHQLTDPKMGAAWVAPADGVPVGYLLAVYVFSLERLGLTAEIDEFYVLPDKSVPGDAVARLKAGVATMQMRLEGPLRAEMNSTNAGSGRPGIR